ncbi:SA1002 family membrane protein, partial [Staphylococcus aureus]|uniref:SA1002 family membrane protein n=1 Tax=Staphylococcus aureus TaxID=1280 RepID=UPI003D05AFD7
VLGGLIGVVQASGSFESGLLALTKKTKGHEFTYMDLVVVPILKSLWMGIILILISSIFQLFIVRLLFRKKNVDLTEVVVLEHLIQWFLVYFAIYQAVNEKMDINDINIDNFQSVFFDVSNLNLVILPTLIISWVTIFNYRMRSYK